MAISIVMPALEMAQETGKLLAWLKKEGDRVTKGEPLLEIETDKVAVELEAPGDGVLAGIVAQVGAVVPVGETIAWIVAPGEKPPAESSNAAVRDMAQQARHGGAAVLAAPSPTPAPAAAPANTRVRISPKARKIAEEKGVDITRLKGTGPEGAISSDDVLAAAAATSQPAPAAAAPQAAPQASSAIARLMAERTTQSWTQTPHFFLVREVHAAALLDAREQMLAAVEKSHGVKITHTDFLVYLTARVLANHPKLNASWVGGAIRLNPNINVSVAIAVKDGVVGAVIGRANTLALPAIALQRKDLADRARSGHLRPADVADGTFTISNLGMFGIDAFSAIITPPQAAILAVGRIAERFVPVAGRPRIRPMVTLTLSSDHRVVDGAQSAVFLNELAEAIEKPLPYFI